MSYRFNHPIVAKPLCTLALLFMSCNGSVAAQTIVYGIDKAHHLSSHAHGPFYVQTAVFDSANKANSYIRNLKKTHFKYPVALRVHGDFHTVVIGPIASASEVRTLIIPNNPPAPSSVMKKIRSHTTKPGQPAQSIALVKTAPHTDQMDKYGVSTKSFLKSHGFAQVDLGFTNHQSTNANEVFNGAVDPYPANVDVYSNKEHKSGGMVSLIAGLRWQEDRLYLPAYSVAVRYQNFFNQKLSGTIMQYSDPDFVNYHYDWNISSNVFSLYSKVNLAQSHNFLPYVSAGIGSAINKSGSYSETALPNIVARTDSPNFSSQTKNQFTYTLGAGLDYQLNKKLLISIGYEFQDLGDIRSGYGQYPWSAEQLGVSNYKNNSVLLSLSYLPDA